MIYAIFSFAFIFFTLACWWAVYLDRNPVEQPKWFEKTTKGIVGDIVIFIAAFMVILSIVFSYSPDSFWD